MAKGHKIPMKFSSIENEPKIKQYPAVETVAYTSSEPIRHDGVPGGITGVHGDYPHLSPVQDEDEDTDTSAAAFPWDGLTTDDELNQFMMKDNLLRPEDWDKLSTDEKKLWMNDNIIP